MSAIYNVIRTYLIFNIVLLCQGYPGNGIGFGYQESEERNEAAQNALHKKPVDLPSRCKPGELYYPGDQGDDWVCDCRPGFVYYPLQSRCFEAYRRGPCQRGHYLVLPKEEVLPKCVRSPCPLEDYVWFNGTCHELNKPGPCPVPELENVIGVDETTLEIICTKGFNILANRFGDANTEQGDKTNTTEQPTNATITNEDLSYYNRRECFIGGIRWTAAKCPQQDSINRTK